MKTPRRGVGPNFQRARGRAPSGVCRLCSSAEGLAGKVVAALAGASVLSPLPYRPLQLRNELLQGQPKRPTERPQFDNVNASLATLALGHKRLCFADLSGELHLRKAGPLSRFPEDLEKNGVAGGVDGFFHCVRERNGNRLRVQG
jgi:hypothetical protein